MGSPFEVVRTPGGLGIDAGRAYAWGVSRSVLPAGHGGRGGVAKIEGVEHRASSLASGRWVGGPA